MSLIPYVSTWLVLALVVAGMAAYRYVVAKHEDRSLHVVEEDPGLISQQLREEKKLESIDRWGKSLTVIVVLYGLAILGVYLYHVWQEAYTIRP